tara:strand:+ start:51189 stop:53066 length:1878 start_codon:yes stop_codon:yes gene_type:complete
MSHEIRTPMNGIIGIIDILRQSSLRPKQLEFAETIKDSAYSLLSVIDDILDFSKIEADKIELENELVVLSSLIESICKSMVPIAQKGNVKLHFYLSPCLPTTIFSDSVRIRQILINLVNNAIKFSGHNDKPGIVHVKLEADSSGRCVIRVRDNGIGMTETTLNTIFDPFSQADSSTTRRFGGTGLGMPICNRLVELMEGTLTVESELNIGSTFTVRIPIEAAEKPGKPEYEQQLKGVTCYLYALDSDMGNDWLPLLQQAGANVSLLDKPEDILKQQESIVDGKGKSIFIAVDDAISIDDYQILLQKKVLVHLENMIVIRPLLTGIVTVVSDIMTLVDDNPYINTTFHFVLAVIAGDNAIWDEELASDNITLDNMPVLDREQAAAQGRLVLVAEDNEINQKVIRTQLEHLNYAYDIASDGQEALMKYREGNYSILLTDIHMPLLDGYELTQTIRKDEKKGIHIPILAFTANATKGEAKRCMEAGMDDYLSKPVAMETLKEKLGQWTLKNEADSSLPILDVDVLVSHIGDEPELIREFLEAYYHSVVTAKAEINKTLQTQNLTLLGGLAHSLQSSSLAVGAMKVANFCAVLAKAGMESDENTVKASMPVFTQSLEDVMIAITQELKE